MSSILRGRAKIVPHLKTNFETERLGFRSVLMCDFTRLSNLGTGGGQLVSLKMLYNALLSLTAFMFCLSLFLVHRARVLENDFRKLQGDIILQLNQPCSEGVDGKLAKMLKTSEVCH